jgi:osmotically-inducible protein OsmY
MKLHQFAVQSTLALSIFAAFGLVACQPKQEPGAQAPAGETTVGQKIDGALADAEKKANEVKADAKSAASEASADTRQAMNTASNAVKDAGITAAVNAKLAADPGLSALRINVDTAGGRVALSGDAPDTAARDRATALARSVEGVVEVENRLTLQQKG